MAVQQNFRTAFNGFNREDVVRYIEFLNAKHTAEVNQLHSELEYLRGAQVKSEEAASETPAEPQEEKNDDLIEHQAGRIRELFDENNELLKQLAAVREENKAMEALLQEAEAEKTRLTAELESALQQRKTAQSRMDEELEAYRRAERTERLARERADQLYRQANGALADATGKVDEAAGQIGELTDRVMAQLGELQAAVTGSKQALRDAAATMYAICPNAGEE